MISRGVNLERLVQMVSKFPGLGTRSAQRVILHLLRHKATLLEPFIEHLEYLSRHCHPCAICGYFDERRPCGFCTSTTRDPSVLCVVAQTGDVWALEQAAFFKGRYHVLGGLLSAFEGVHPEDLRLESLFERLDGSVEEVILALDGHLEGQATLHYLMQELSLRAPLVKVSMLARGMPMGGELSYLDQGTLQSAFSGRKPMEKPSISELRKEGDLKKFFYDS